MSDEQSGNIHSASEGGMAGTHPAADSSPLLVGSSTEQQFNTAHLPLIPIACWRLEDVRFVFDSSFVLPDARDEMQLLAALIRDHTKDSVKPPISIFGHADPTGTDDYNKYLSGRRAAVIYGLLTRRSDVWEDLYSDGGQFSTPVQGDKWGLKSLQTILTELGFPAAADGQMGPETRTAVQNFQSQNGLPANGNPDASTRKKLFLEYMDKICADQSGAPYQIDKGTGFLGRNADAGGKADFQGCGEFNPTLIFSDQENTEFQQDQDKTTRDAVNQPNRRVVVLLFRPGSRVLTAKWPCPLAKAGTGDCQKRFWSDGDARRNTRLPNQERKYELTKDTFACRFYDRLTHLSPCEHTGKPLALRWIGWVSKGQETDSSIVLNDPAGKELGRYNGIADEVPGYDGVSQQFDFSLKPQSVDFKLSPVAGQDVIAPPMLFKMQELIQSQLNPENFPKAVTVESLTDTEES
jgi:peptidoglycan hydrolase-like protein with peptidoglycan-binding domain